jgi:hypothetical protein
MVQVRYHNYYRLRNLDWKHPFNLLAFSVTPAHTHLQFSTAIDSIDYVPGIKMGARQRHSSYSSSYASSAQLLPSLGKLASLLHPPYPYACVSVLVIFTDINGPIWQIARHQPGQRKSQQKLLELTMRT